MPTPDDIQIQCFRRMTPGQRLQAGARLYWSARNLKRAAMRSFHPEWTEEAVEREVKRMFLHGTD
jgi:hypothetical protein